MAVSLQWGNSVVTTLETAGARFSEAEWLARLDLAAAYRLSVQFGWEYLIYNHIVMRVPGEPCFLVKPHDLMFSEVTASNLLKLRLDGKQMTFAENVNTAAFTIHTAVLNSRPDINCTLHVHTAVGMAISAHKKGLLPLVQNAMQFYNRLSYHEYEGFSMAMSEAERIARDLGPRNMAMILRNHGLLSCGGSVSEAVSTMLNLVSSCEAQLMLEASGAEMIVPPADVCEEAALHFERRHPNNEVREDWPALLRSLERTDPSYKQ